MDTVAPAQPTINYGPGISSAGTERRPTFVVGLESTRARTGLYSDAGCRTLVSNSVTYPSTTSVTLRLTEPLAIGDYTFHALETDVAGNRACSAGLAYRREGQAVIYDVDADGLIDIDSLEKLNAVRYDLDGNGRADNDGDIQRYEQAFPDPQGTGETASLPFMGCPGDNCTGYELTADLDFADSRWSRTSSTQGWAPIGGANTFDGPFLATNFRGNGHTISNLYINRPTENVGLFRHLRHQGAVVEGVGLINVDVTGGDQAGGLAASFIPGSEGDLAIISACYVTGVVNAGRSGAARSFTRGGGGLIGGVYSTSRNHFLIRASYAMVSVNGTLQNVVGGLVGQMQSNLTISASYAAGPVRSSGGFGSGTGGLVGGLIGSDNTISNSYWDREATGQSSSVGGGGARTGRDLRAPTTYTGIYSGWNLDLNGVAVGDNPWAFGTRIQYPVLRYGSSDTAADTARQFAIQPRASSENRLIALTIEPEPGVLTPAFSSATTTYEAEVVLGTDSVTVGGTAADARYPVVVFATSADTDPAAGYQVSPLFPNVSTQVTVTLTAEDYSTRQYTINIEVPSARSADADLADLSVSPATLAPSFDAARTTYAATVDGSVRRVTVAARPNHRLATVRLAPGAMVDLGLGENVITATVTAQDGVTEKAYVITVTRLASTDADLAELSVSSGVGVMQRFDLAGDTTRHTVVVPFTVGVVTVTAVTRDDRARVSNRSIADADGDVPGHQVSLRAGETTTITITVTAEDGSTDKQYEVGVRREAASSDARLSELRISPGDLSPSFDAARTMYTATVDGSVRSLAVTATANFAAATVRIEPREMIGLGVGEHVITATVTAQDGVTEEAYVITVTRLASTDADLAELSVSSGVGMVQRFDLAGGATRHAVVVPFTADVVTVTATARDDRAGLSVTSDAAVASGDASGYRVNVPAGETITITVTVTAEDGTTRKAYEIAAMREAPSSEARLRELHVSGIGVDDALDVAGATTRYTVVLPPPVGVVTVTATVRDDRARSLIIEPGDADGDVPGHQVSVAAGDRTTVTVTVTAEDGVTLQAYRITVARPLSSNADLQSLRVSATEVGELSIGTFDADTLAYELLVEQLSVEQVTVFATPAGFAATLDYSWTDADGGSGSGAELTLLPVGATTLTVTVTAADGSMKAYTVMVSKSRGRLANLAVSAGVLNFRGTQAGYTLNVANIVTSLRVTATAVVGDTMIRITDPAGDGSITAGAEAVTIIGLPGGLRLGSNRVEITATGSDGTNGTYTVNVVRAQADFKHLADLSVQGHVLVPPFAGNRFGSGNRYTVRVPHRVTSVRFMATARPFAMGSNSYNGIFFYDVTGGVDNELGSTAFGILSSLDQTVGNLRVGTTNLRIDKKVGRRTAIERSYFVDVIRAGRSDANLSALGISPGELAPAFSSATTAYTATADSSVSRLAVSATANDANATVRIEPGETVDLAPGANVITATVTAQDGVTEKAYVITVTRPAASDADLAELGVSSGSGVMQRFDLAAATQHTVLVPFPVGVVTVTAVARDDRARLSVVAPADAAVDADDHRVNQQVNLRAGATTTITIRVTAEDGTTRKRYEIKAMREAASSDADLAELGISSGVGVTRFDLAGDTTEHAISVPFAADVVTVTAVARHDGADVVITPDDADAGVPGHQVNLVAGVETAINIRVTAEDGVTMQAYRITVDRALSSNADLRSLRVSAAGVGELSIGTFDADTLAYELLVEQLSVEQVTVLATTDGFAATLDYLWADADGGAGVGTELSLLPVGATTLTITVTAQDGSVKAYTVAVSKSRGRLTDLMVSVGVLNFRGAQTDYSVNVVETVTSLRVTATAAAGDTAIRITDPAGDGSTAESEVAATIIGLPGGLRHGSNRVEITATGSDGTSNTYVVDVVRAEVVPGSRGHLAQLSVSQGSLVPPFANGRFGSGSGSRYVVRVPNRVTSVRFMMTMVKQQIFTNYPDIYLYDITGGMETLLGSRGVGGNPSYNQDVDNLRAGTTRLRIDVGRRFGGTLIRDYYVDVIRAGSSDANLSALGVSPGELEPAFSSATLVYGASVTDTVASVEVTPMANDDGATVEIDGVTVARRCWPQHIHRARPEHHRRHRGNGVGRGYDEGLHGGGQARRSDGRAGIVVVVGGRADAHFR